MTDPIEVSARELGLAPSALQLDQLQRFVALLQRWNATYNLTAVRDPADIASHHIADCLAVLPSLQRRGDGGRLLDVGSGGGLPGIVVAIMLPSFDVTCVDAVGKKAAFVRQAAGALALPNLRAAHARVEALAAPAFDVVASRAFASLGDFCALTRPLLSPGGVWLAMKGRVPDDEIAALPAGIDVFHVEPITVPGLDAQRCIVWMRPR